MLNRLGCSFMILSFVAVLAGCRQAHNQDTREANAPGAAQSASTGASQRDGGQVALTGCLEPAAPPGTYALRNVQVGGRGANDPDRNTSSPGQHGAAAGQPGITEGSWVRLTGSRELQAHAGRRVAVSGVVIDSGQNTIGTAGTSGSVVTPSGDVSQAAGDEHHSTKVKKEAGRIARESMANGTAAEIKVTAIRDLGEACEDRRIRR